MNWFEVLCAEYFKNHPKLVLDSSNWYSGQPENVRTHFNTSVFRTGVGSIKFDPMILGRLTTDSSLPHTIAYEVQNEINETNHEQKYTKKRKRKAKVESNKVQNIKHDSYNTMN